MMSGVESLTVVLADDHRLLLSSLSRLLKRHGIDVVGEAVNGEDAVSEVEAKRPAVAILDMRMGPVDGLEAARRIHASTDTKVVIMSGAADQHAAEASVAAGAVGFVSKACSPDEFIHAIVEAAAGRETIIGVPTSSEIDAPPAPFGLSSREREVLVLVAQGYGRTDIGLRLGISPRTVDTHRTQVFKKLGVHSIAEAARAAERAGLIRT